MSAERQDCQQGVGTSLYEQTVVNKVGSAVEHLWVGFSILCYDCPPTVGLQVSSNSCWMPAMGILLCICCWSSHLMVPLGSVIAIVFSLLLKCCPSVVFALTTSYICFSFLSFLFFISFCRQFLKSIQKAVLEKLNLQPNKSSVALCQSLRIGAGATSGKVWLNLGGV